MHLSGFLHQEITPPTIIRINFESNLGRQDCAHSSSGYAVLFQAHMDICHELCFQWPFKPLKDQSLHGLMTWMQLPHTINALAWPVKSVSHNLPCKPQGDEPGKAFEEIRISPSRAVNAASVFPKSWQVGDTEGPFLVVQCLLRERRPAD